MKNVGWRQEAEVIPPDSRGDPLHGEDWPAAKIFEKPIDAEELLKAVGALLKEEKKEKKRK